jgi:hypothetical protein
MYPLFARHRDVTTKPHDVYEAYKVYSAILSTIGQSPLVIGIETQTVFSRWTHNRRRCFAPQSITTSN